MTRLDSCCTAFTLLLEPVAPQTGTWWELVQCPTCRTFVRVTFGPGESGDLVLLAAAPSSGSGPVPREN